MTDDLVKRLSEENNLLRSVLSHSKDPCIYCGLAADRLAQSCFGFPGYDRADDMINCPELGASLALKDADLRIEKLEAALREIHEVYAGSEGIPEPMTAAEGYLLRLLTEIIGVTSKTLEGKDD